MAKLSLSKPSIFLLYGYPGSGKSSFARQLADELGMAHVHSDRIRYELFEQPRFDKQENEIVNHLMTYMAEEFLRAGISVIFDTNALRFGQRRMLRDMARKLKATPVLIWIQIDLESAFTRVVKRDRRKSDDRYAIPMDRTTFEQFAGMMQNPTTTEDFAVISGKHTFTTQRHMILKKLYDLGLIQSPVGGSQGVVKPGLVNLVPNHIGGRVDPTRRNITIR